MQQSEADLEKKLIRDLINLGYVYRKDINKINLEDNLRLNLQRLNNYEFSDNEWSLFLSDYLKNQHKNPMNLIQNDYIYTIKKDNEPNKNILLLDKKNLENNYLEVINQFEADDGLRYDVSILINGLPLVHIELKKRGVSIKDAFNQIDNRYINSFNKSLFRFIQIFVISNGTFSRYFANNTLEYDFSCEYADEKNNNIRDLEDFAPKFFERKNLLDILFNFMVFTSENKLLILRPYQINACKSIINKITNSFNNNLHSQKEAFGYIWHTTGSGKTLTSFKVSKMISELDFVDKVFFVVDRKDLDYQTKKEYDKFEKGCVNGSKSTKELIKNINSDAKIIVTTIQKLNEFIKKNKDSEIYNKCCVFIFDECHRSQFGEAQKNIKNQFRKYYQFGFTGTPIFAQNAINLMTTEDIFGERLHSYVITDAIKDKKVLGFKVDYYNLLPKFKEDEKCSNDENHKEILEHPQRIEAIVKFINENYDKKTSKRKFNAMLAVSNISMAKAYYNEFKRAKSDLKVATIFSYNINDEKSEDESFNVRDLRMSDREFLALAIDDYNKFYNDNYSIDTFEEYYENLSKRVKDKEIDLIIVVGMFLTGFDAKTLNTLFVDKNLKYHALIQAFSRTNRIYNATKSFGNIVCFRNLDDNVNDAIKLFGNSENIDTILVKDYEKYYKKYLKACDEIIKIDTSNLYTKDDKKRFFKLFASILRYENILKFYDEFSPKIDDRLKQNLQSMFITIKDDITKPNNEEVEFQDLEFDIELLKAIDIDLDYILNLHNNGASLEEKQRVLRASESLHMKRDLINDFFKENMDRKVSKDDFYKFKQDRQNKEIDNFIKEEHLKEGAKEFIEKSIEKGYIENFGSNFNNILPKTRLFSDGGESHKTLSNDILSKIEKFINLFNFTR